SALSGMAQLTRAPPRMGPVQRRAEGRGGPDARRRWIPRLKTGTADHSTSVFSAWEGAVCLQRRAFDECGGWPAPFWYAHEGIELAWRVWDAGDVVWCMGDRGVAQPVRHPRRPDEDLDLYARNRAWLARRSPP